MMWTPGKNGEVDGGIPTLWDNIINFFKMLHTQKKHYLSNLLISVWLPLVYLLILWFWKNLEELIISNVILISGMQNYVFLKLEIFNILWILFFNYLITFILLFFTIKYLLNNKRIYFCYLFMFSYSIISIYFWIKVVMLMWV